MYSLVSLLAGLIFGFTALMLVYSKNRRPGLWFSLGCLFGIFAVLSISSHPAPPNPCFAASLLSGLIFGFAGVMLGQIKSRGRGFWFSSGCLAGVLFLYLLSSALWAL